MAKRRPELADDASVAARQPRVEAGLSRRRASFPEASWDQVAAYDLGWRRYQVHRGLGFASGVATRVLGGLAAVAVFNAAVRLGDWVPATWLAGAVAAATVLGYAFVRALWLRTSLRIARDGASEPDHLLLATATIPLVSLVVWLGYVLLVVPGIWLSERYRFAALLALDRGLGPASAMRESWRMTRGRAWEMFRFDFWGFVRMAPQGTFLSGATRFDRKLAGDVADALAYLHLTGRAPDDVRAALDPSIEPAPTEVATAPVAEAEATPEPEVTEVEMARAAARRQRGRKRDGAAPRCPRCERKLERYRAPELEIDLCRRCGGCWADNALSQRLVQQIEYEAVSASEVAASAATRRPQRNGTAPCPVCDRIMESTSVQRVAVVVDFCAEHGTWFDRDELKRVTLAADATRARLPGAALSPGAGSTGQVYARGAGAIGGGALRGVIAAVVDDDRE